MRESVVEKYLKKKSKENGFLCYKFSSPSNDGVPDRVLVGHGLTFFVELKAPGKTPRKLQEYVIGEIKDHGGTVYVIDTKEGVDELFVNILKNGLTNAE